MKKKILSLLPLIVILAIVFAIYRYTSPGGIGWVDAGTIATAAHTLGIPNPPGFPLYVILGYLFTRIPLGTSFVKLEIFSHLGALITLGAAYWLVVFLAKKVNYENGKLLGLLTVLCLAFSYNFWSQAKNIETFALTNAFLFILVAWTINFSDRLQERVTLNTREKLTIFAICVFGGISTGLNPTISVSLGVAIWFAWRHRRLIGKNKDTFLIATIIAISSVILIYSYLPLRASQKPFLNWGDPVTLERIGNHLVGARLNIYEPETNSINGFTGQPKVWWESFWHYIDLSFFQFTPVLFPLIILGGVTLFRRVRTYFWALMGVVLFNLAYVVLYYGGNQESWMISSFVVMAVFLGFGFGECWQWLESKNIHFTRLARGALVCASLLPLFFWFSVANQRGYVFAEDYQENLYRGILPGSVIIGGGDFYHALTNYEHEVTKRGSDITPLLGNMFYIFDWYREDVRYHTDLVISDQAERIIQFKSAEEFTDVVDQVITDNPDKQFYVTSLLLRDTVVAGHKEGNYHTRKYKLLPHGLVYKVVPLDSLEQVDLSLYDFSRTNRERPFYLERNYKNAFSLLERDYAEAFSNLANYYFELGDQTSAEKYFKKAIEVGDPLSPEFYNRLALFYLQTKQTEQAKSTFQKAISLDPDNQDLKQNYINFLKEIGELPDDRGQEFKNELMSFVYPSSLGVTDQGGGVIRVQDDQSNFAATIRVGAKGEETPEKYVYSQKETYGILLNQGVANIPNVDWAYVKTWNQSGISYYEFFLFKGEKVFNLFVGPSTSNLMTEFDQILATLE